MLAVVDECQVRCVLLNNDVDPIVRRAVEAVDALAFTPRRKLPCC
jgi:hypothetical protein